MKLQNKIAVVTGGADGLGLSLTKALIAKGAFVNIITRNVANHLASLESLPGDRYAVFEADVSKYDQIAEVIGKIPHIDILVNNAAVWIEGLITENSPEAISQAIDINTKGVLFMTKAVLPAMIAQNDGYIINISSTTGLKGRAGQTVYAASKFALSGFNESLKEDLATTDIKVVGFFPGGMSTKLFEKSGHPKSNADWMDTKKVADVLIFILEQENTMILDHVVLNKRNTKTSN